jgi:hypothetical protein
LGTSCVLELPDGAGMSARRALSRADGLEVMGSVAGSIRVGAVFANPYPEGCLNVEPVFVAALWATHVEKIGHGLNLLVLK